MKRLLAVLAALVAVSIIGSGCETTAHDQYRQMTYRRSLDADALGIQDDFDAGVLLTERPSHLSPWYNK
jgi:hypothetical protein